jgi:hypothetical protein
MRHITNGWDFVWITREKCDKKGIIMTKTHVYLLLILFVCFESHEQFFSYLATVTIAGDRAAYFDLCLALTAFSSEGSFTCHAYCDTGPPFLRSYPKDQWFYLLNAVLLAKEQSLPILNVLGLTRPARAGLKLTTYRLLSEGTTIGYGNRYKNIDTAMSNRPSSNILNNWKILFISSISAL